MERQPNTIYVASVSYGKDSLAMLEAIKILGYPLDRIVHAEVWATQTISADQPPMVEFKAKADKIIKERYGIEVEHICATKKSQNVQVERAEVAESDDESSHLCRRTYEDMFYRRLDTGKHIGNIKGFPVLTKGGADTSSSERENSTSKLTYEDIFYRTYTPRNPKVMRGGNSGKQEQCTDLRCAEETGATLTSRGMSSTDTSRIYGFPHTVGGWCKKFKHFRTSPRTTGRK